MKRSVASFALGTICGLAVVTSLGGGLGFLYVRRAEMLSRRGWFRPVLLATRDLPAGGKLDRTDVRVGDVPDHFTTSTLVAGDDPSVFVDRTLAVPVRAGEPLRHTHLKFAGLSPEDRADAEACEAELGSGAQDAGAAR